MCGSYNGNIGAKLRNELSQDTVKHFLGWQTKLHTTREGLAFSYWIESGLNDPHAFCSWSSDFTILKINRSFAAATAP